MIDHYRPKARHMRIDLVNSVKIYPDHGETWIRPFVFVGDRPVWKLPRPVANWWLARHHPEVGLLPRAA